MNKLYSVHDHWTDINKKNDVDIESIDGVITGIKVNGEDYGGGGSSDFSTAEVTFIGTEEPDITLSFINIQDDGIYSVVNIRQSTQTVTAPLYKNKLSCTIQPFFMSVTSTSGNITGSQTDGYIISGNCTINYTLPM